MDALTLSSPVTCLSGIKTARAAQLQKLGIRTLYDLIAYFPRDYEDRTRIAEIGSLEPGVPACFEAMVVAAPKTSYIRKGLEITRLTVADCTGSLHLVYFNQPYLSSALHYGETYRFFGTLQEEPSRQMQNPVFESAQNAGGVTGRLVPVYALTAGLSNNVLQKAIRQALDACLGTLPDILPESVRTEYKLCGVQFAYETIHAPASREALMQARTRLVFEEFFIFSAGLQMLRDVRCDESAVPCDISGADAFEAALPFRLTGAQQRAIRDVLRDMASGHPMNRLVQGDVGSGKTMIAAAAAFCAAKNGLQAAFLVPTEILARQHFASLRALMSCFSIETVLLTGSMPAAEKRRVKEAVASSERTRSCPAMLPSSRSGLSSPTSSTASASVSAQRWQQRAVLRICSSCPPRPSRARWRSSPTAIWIFPWWTSCRPDGRRSTHSSSESACASAFMRSCAVNALRAVRRTSSARPLKKVSWNP